MAEKVFNPKHNFQCLEPHVTIAGAVCLWTADKRTHFERHLDTFHRNEKFDKYICPFGCGYIPGCYASYQYHIGGISKKRPTREKAIATANCCRHYNDEFTDILPPPSYNRFRWKHLKKGTIHEPEPEPEPCLNQKPCGINEDDVPMPLPMPMDVEVDNVVHEDEPQIMMHVDDEEAEIPCPVIVQLVQDLVQDVVVTEDVGHLMDHLVHLTEINSTSISMSSQTDMTFEHVEKNIAEVSRLGADLQRVSNDRDEIWKEKLAQDTSHLFYVQNLTKEHEEKLEESLKENEALRKANEALKSDWDGTLKDKNMELKTLQTQFEAKIAKLQSEIKAVNKDKNEILNDKAAALKILHEKLEKYEEELEEALKEKEFWRNGHEAAMKDRENMLKEKSELEKSNQILKDEYDKHDEEIKLLRTLNENLRKRPPSPQHNPFGWSGMETDWNRNDKSIPNPFYGGRNLPQTSFGPLAGTGLPYTQHCPHPPPPSSSSYDYYPNNDTEVVDILRDRPISGFIPTPPLQQMFDDSPVMSLQLQDPAFTERQLATCMKRHSVKKQKEKKPAIRLPELPFGHWIDQDNFPTERDVYVDGENIAFMQHNGRMNYCLLESCVMSLREYTSARIIIIFKQVNPKYQGTDYGYKALQRLQTMHNCEIRHVSSFRDANGIPVKSYDDARIFMEAYRRFAVIVSGDRFHDIIFENPAPIHAFAMDSVLKPIPGRESCNCSEDTPCRHVTFSFEDYGRNAVSITDPGNMFKFHSRDFYMHRDFTLLPPHVLQKLEHECRFPPPEISNF